MKPIPLTSLLLAALASTACVTQPPAPTAAPMGGGGAIDTSGWRCSARGMVMGRYGGGDDAYIQLAGDQRGGNYPIRLNQSGNVATGITGNGTPFSCSKR